MKRLAILATILGSLVFATVAPAAMTYDQARFWGHFVAKQDCGRPLNYACTAFPTFGITYVGAPNRWFVTVGYEEQKIIPFWNHRICYTDTHWIGTTGRLTYAVKYCH